VAKAETACSCISFLHQSSLNKAQTFENEYLFLFIFYSFIGIASSSDYKASISSIINELERIMRRWHGLLEVFFLFPRCSHTWELAPAFGA
jgi:hypothetical protein